jgi:hypothetical protein
VKDRRQRRGAGSSPSGKQFAPSLSRASLLSLPSRFPALTPFHKIPSHLPRQAFLKVRVNSYEVMDPAEDLSEGPAGNNCKLRRDTLARPLPAKFVEEVILLQ